MIAGALAVLARAVSGVSARWLSDPAGARQRIYFANHCSHLDFLVVWASLPPEVRVRTRPVAARDYWERGRLRRHLAERVFRGVLIDRAGARNGANPVERMLSALDGGDSLILFPEGTRGDGARVAEFRSGLYHLAAARSEVELLPVGIENLNRVLPKGEAVPVPVISRLTFGRPLAICEDEDKAAFLARARRAVEELVGS
jgi:1-acyl-sn-glycerol-3-phosphate acyltransferase